MVKKKVLIPIDLDMKKLGQMETFYVALAKYCAARNIIVDYILPKVPVKRVQDMFSDTNIKWFVFDRWWQGGYEEPRNNLAVASFVIKVIKEKKYGLVLFNFCAIETVVLVALFCKLKREKLKIAWVQHSEIAINEDGFYNKFKNYFSRIYIMSLLIDKIYCVSKQVGTQVLAKNVAIDKVEVLYNGIDFHQFCLSGEYQKEVFIEFGYQNCTRLVIVVANPREEKGIQILLRAVPEIISKCSDVAFLIVGSGPYLKNLEDIAQQLNICEYITFSGSRSDVPRLLSAAYIAVQPSLKESFGNSVVEAMAAGLPVVGSAVGGIPEIIEDNAGILVPPGNSNALAKAIITLLNNKQLVEEYGRNAKKSVRMKFSLEIALENYYREFSHCF